MIQTSLSIGLSMKILKAIFTYHADQSVSRSAAENTKGMMQPNISGEPLSEKHKNNDRVHTLVRERKPLSDRKWRTAKNLFRGLQQRSTASSTACTC